jgi:hypothetical protein
LLPDKINLLILSGKLEKERPDEPALNISWSIVQLSHLSGSEGGVWPAGIVA